MGIYTKTGDQGTTSLFDGQRVKKYAIRVDTYGSFDECGATISVAEKLSDCKKSQEQLRWVQKELFFLNAEIATAEQLATLQKKSQLIQETEVQTVETWIDEYTKELPPVEGFILPGQSLVAAQLHVARTVCRRGERRLIELAESEEIRSVLKQFVNRLSDFLYILARAEDFYKQENQLIETIYQRYQERNEKVINKNNHFTTVHSIMAACLKKAQEIEVSVAVTIVSNTGQQIASFTMPDSLLVSTEMAKKKAYTAVAMKQATLDLKQVVQPGEDLYQLETLTNGQIVSFGGGIPLYNQENQIVYGLGVSGGTVNEDQLVAKAGLQRMKEINDAG